nr:MAG TPA: Protein of unknown function (DUF739) [Caudoviricetes sp.]
MTGFDNRNLRERIKKIYGNQSGFAKDMELSERSISLKLTGARQWRQSEIYRAKELLKIKDKDIAKYFLTRCS